MTVRILTGDVRAVLPTLAAESVHCVVTSPPYWGLRDYGVDGQMGTEDSLGAHISAMVEVFREVRRVLRKDGTCWLNYGDFYAGGGRGGNPEDSPFRKQATNRGSLIAPTPVEATGLKPKDLCLAPWRLAIALQEDGWWIRSAIPWVKPNPMPESVTDRPTNCWEPIFLLTKSAKYFYDAEAVRENAEYGFTPKPGMYDRIGNAGKAPIRTTVGSCPDGSGGSRNLRNAWIIPTHPFPDAHFATFPPAIPERCIKAGCPEDGLVLDPFGGSGTVGLVADRLKRDALLIELNPEYAEMARRRIEADAGLFGDVAADLPDPPKPVQEVLV